MRRLVAIPVVLALLIVVAPAAAAAGPEHTSVTFTVDARVFPCDGFEIIAGDGTVRRNMLTWYDAAGNPVLERWTIHFDIPLTNSVTGLTGVYSGHFVRVYDAVANTLEVLGNRKVQIDGRNVLSVSGHALFDETAGALVFQRGHGDLETFFEAWCSPMAG